ALAAWRAGFEPVLYEADPPAAAGRGTELRPDRRADLEADRRAGPHGGPRGGGPPRPPARAAAAPPPPPPPPAPPAPPRRAPPPPICGPTSGSGCWTRPRRAASAFTTATAWSARSRSRAASASDLLTAAPPRATSSSVPTAYVRPCARSSIRARHARGRAARA